MLIRRQASIRVDRPLGEVWAVVSDPEHHEAWRARRIELLEPKRRIPRRGSRFVRLGSQTDAAAETVEISNLAAPTRVAWQVSRGARRPRMVEEACSLTERGSGTEVTFSVTYQAHGVLGTIAGLLYARRLQREVLPGLLPRLKRLIEQRPTLSGSHENESTVDAEIRPYAFRISTLARNDLLGNEPSRTLRTPTAARAALDRATPVESNSPASFLVAATRSEAADLRDWCLARGRELAAIDPTDDRTAALAEAAEAIAGTLHLDSFGPKRTALSSKGEPE